MKRNMFDSKPRTQNSNTKFRKAFEPDVKLAKSVAEAWQMSFESPTAPRSGHVLTQSLGKRFGRIEVVAGAYIA